MNFEMNFSNKLNLVVFRPDRLIKIVRINNSLIYTIGKHFLSLLSSGYYFYLFVNYYCFFFYTL